MSYGPFYDTHLGVFTLFEYLQRENIETLPWRKVNKLNQFIGSKQLKIFFFHF